MDEKELTFGQQAVGIKFNPSNDSAVDKCKQAFAGLIDICYDIKTESYLGNTVRWEAIRVLIVAQMLVVKLLTLPTK